MEKTRQHPLGDVAGLRPTPGRLVQLALIGLVRLYQLAVSPFLGRHCRFHPSCSEYALQALREHGPLSGAWLAVRRLLRCHPFNAGGADPVPEAAAVNQRARGTR